MWSGIAAEYHKIDGDLDKFLAQIERIKFGGYDKFQIDYLRYVNNRTQTRADADKLIAFYQRQIAYFQNRFGDSQVTQEYQKLLSELQGRGWHNQ
jgi:ABC-type Fe3+-hydroxamate transport system substrate-binding protein